MEALRWEKRPELRRPVLVCAFKGWNDAAESATGALEFLAREWDAARLASIDPDEFFDFQVTRPTVRLTEGQTREIVWPEVVLWEASPEGGVRDLALLSGAEPNLRWRNFCGTIISAARDIGAEMVVSLGALLADVPHTRPVQITGIAGDPALVERLRLLADPLRGADRDRRRPARRLHAGGAAVHRASGRRCRTTSPPFRARRHRWRCFRCWRSVTDVHIDVSELEQCQPSSTRSGSTRRSRTSPRSSPWSSGWSSRWTQDEVSFGDLPSGDSIARDFQRFLREQGRRGRRRTVRADSRQADAGVLTSPPRGR